jgi:trans-2,3-dihydro-3-hydroxyanthranilate isomerase
MSRRYYTLDVFTETPLAGNPLAVVLDADDLSGAQMQAIAREFNLAETVFVCMPRDPVNTARIRIFTIGAELPFAGHPIVGTAILLARLNAPEMMRSSGGVRIALEEMAGLVPCDVSQRANGVARAVFRTPKLSERRPFEGDLSLIDRAIGVDAAAIGFDAHEVSLWHSGIGYVMVPVKSLADLAKVGIRDLSVWEKAFGRSPDGEREVSIYVYTRAEPGSAHDVRARMFMPSLGMPEDPATGSAVACFAGAAVAFERPADGSHQILIGQGYELGRPSDIALDVRVENGALTESHIGGSAVLVSEGLLHV